MNESDLTGCHGPGCGQGSCRLEEVSSFHLVPSPKRRPPLRLLCLVRIYSSRQSNISVSRAGPVTSRQGARLTQVSQFGIAKLHLRNLQQIGKLFGGTSASDRSNDRRLGRKPGKRDGGGCDVVCGRDLIQRGQYLEPFFVQISARGLRSLALNFSAGAIFPSQESGG